MDNPVFDVVVLALLIVLVALLSGLFLHLRRAGSRQLGPAPSSQPMPDIRSRPTTLDETGVRRADRQASVDDDRDDNRESVDSRRPGAQVAEPVGGAEGAVAAPSPNGDESGPVEPAAAGVELVTGSTQRAAQIRAEAERAAAEIRAEAEDYDRQSRRRADKVLREAQRNRHEADDEIRAQRSEVRDLRLELERREQRVAERESRLDVESQRVHQQSGDLEQVRADLETRLAEVKAAEAAQQHELERVANLTGEQARAELVAAVQHDAKRQAVVQAREIESKAQSEAESRARSIIVSAIQRLASDQTSESVVAAIHLPSDEMKGRIIGREGRNIRSFEQVTGVNVLIDDTPETVLLSCFDPVRREAARLTLAELIEDGRIHPVRIEEVHERSKSKISERCLRAAEDALAEVGISDLHVDLIPVVGTLRYRTSYGQNVLKHLVECAHLAGVMAAELGLDVAFCKRAAFLHDIGKALTHEVEGSHALIGADLARKYGEHPDVVHAIEAHHNEVEPRTVEAVLTQAADAISGSRPGARRESLEAYVERLERLEEIALAHEGVEKVFAMQAGREVRVMVTPDVVDDIAAQVLARDIVKQVEEELTYPGQIRVTVVRESRAVETAR